MSLMALPTMVGEHADPPARLGPVLTALHEGGWTATLHHDNTVTFTGPTGQTLQRPPP